MSTFTDRDFDYNMSEIDNDLKAGKITNEEAKRIRDNIISAYQSKSNEKMADQVKEIRKNR
jgi:polyhydroxyalkanoate synthesis regulator phasin